MALTFGSITTAGTVTARTITLDLPDLSLSGLDAAKSVNRHWLLVNGGTVFDNAAATITWNGSDLDPGVITANLKATSVAGVSAHCRSLPP